MGAASVRREGVGSPEAGLGVLTPQNQLGLGSHFGLTENLSQAGHRDLAELPRRDTPQRGVVELDGHRARVADLAETANEVVDRR